MKVPEACLPPVGTGENWLDVLLERRSVTIEQLATEANFTLGRLRRIAEGEAEPTADELAQIALALGITSGKLEKLRANARDTPSRT